MLMNSAHELYKEHPMKILTLILAMLTSSLLFANESVESDEQPADSSTQPETVSELELTPEEQRTLDDTADSETSSLGY